MIETIYDQITPVGLLRTVIEDGFIVSMGFVDDILKHKEHPQLSMQIRAYFEKQEPITFPFKFKRGTIFQKEVWNAMLSIPLGKTKTYKQIGEMINRPKAVRAIGQACKANPIGLRVPCHRIIGSHGEMRGYSGKDNVDLKRRLLVLEKAIES